MDKVNEDKDESKTSVFLFYVIFKMYSLLTYYF